MRIENLEQTCGGCPSSWVFKTDGGRTAFIQYRLGYLSVTIYETDERCLEGQRKWQ